MTTVSDLHIFIPAYTQPIIIMTILKKYPVMTFGSVAHKGDIFERFFLTFPKKAENELTDMSHYCEVFCEEAGGKMMDFVDYTVLQMSH